MSCDTHPVFRHFLNLGGVSERDAAIAFQVYLDLVEVQLLWDVKYAFSSELGLIYLSAKECETQTAPQIFIPMSSSSAVSPAWLQKVQQILTSKSDSSMVLAIKDGDSSIIYYRIMEGMVSPDSPESLKTKKEVEESKRVMQSEIWRQRNHLYEIAVKNSESHPTNQ